MDGELYEKRMDINDLAFCPTCGRRVSNIRYAVKPGAEHYNAEPVALYEMDRIGDITLVPCMHVVEQMMWVPAEAESTIVEPRGDGAVQRVYVPVTVWQFRA